MRRLISGDYLRQAISKSMTAAEASSLPSSQRRGGRDIKKDTAKPPLMERTKWSGTTKHFGLPTTPSAALRRLRDICIDAAATPPVSGGEFPASDSVEQQPRKRRGMDPSRNQPIPSTPRRNLSDSSGAMYSSESP